MRSSYSKRLPTEEVTFGGPFLQTIGGEPKVYWNKRQRVFFGKYKLNGQWKNKVIPVCIDTEEKATKWFAMWLEKLEADRVEPVNDQVQLDERKTIRNLGDRWLIWKSTRDRRRRPRERAGPRALHRLGGVGEEGPTSQRTSTATTR